MDIMTHVLLIVGWSLTVDAVSTANKVVYISCKLAKTTAPPCYLLPESGRGWRAGRGRSHTRTIQALCVLETHRQLKSLLKVVSEEEEEVGRKTERKRRENGIIKGFGVSVGGSVAQDFPQLGLDGAAGGGEEEEGEIDHQGRNNLEISAKALFFLAD